MANILIKKFSPKTHKIKAVVYGGSGSGKTSFGGTAPKPIFASAEGGLLSIAHLNPDYVEIKSLEDLSGLLQFLKTQKHEYETIIIDSITEISEIIKRGIEKKSGRAMQIQDFCTLSKRIRDILAGFRDLDMHVLFIAQEKMEKDGDQVIKIAPSLNGKSADEIAYFMDIVGYLTIDRATNERRIITSTDLKLLTKDRTRMIGNDTTPDFSLWVEAVKGLEVRREEETVVDEELGKVAPLQEDDTPPPPPAQPTQPQARRVPEKMITPAQKKLLNELLTQATAGETDGDKLLRRVAKTFVQVVGLEVNAKEHSSTDTMLDLLSLAKASILIEYLKKRIADKEAEMQAQADADEANAQAEGEANAQAQAEAEASAQAQGE